MESIRTASDGFSHLTFVRGAGAYCWTSDGRKVIDLVCGQGPVILGHANEAVTAAVLQQLGRGVLLPGRGPQLEQLTEMVLRHFPHHSALLPFKTGSEATTAAVRLARAVTGRTKVLRVGFMGWHDQMISPYLRCHSYDESRFETSWPVGVTHEAYSELTDFWFGANAPDLIDRVRRQNGQLAAVVLDPVQIRPAQASEALRTLRETLTASGTLLIIDESKTGFRVHMGGAQAVYGVEPDLTVLSKGLANGFPLAAVLGDRDLLQIAGAAQIKGTFRYELASIAASITTVAQLAEFDVPRLLAARGSALIRAINETFVRAGFRPGEAQAVPYHWPAMPYFHFSGGCHELAEPYQRGMLARGVLFMRDHMNYVCAALGEDDVAMIKAASEYTLREII